MHIAGEALVLSKQRGRNRVGIYVEDQMAMKSNHCRRHCSRAIMGRLATRSRVSSRTEASLLSDAADKLPAAQAEQIEGRSVAIIDADDA